MTHQRIELLGMEIDRLSEREAVMTIHDALGEGHGGWVITPNLDHLRCYRRDPAVRRLFARADLVVADGMPLVWASRLRRSPLPERVAGSDLIWSLSREAARRKRSIFLLGGAPGACEEAAARLVSELPDLRVAGMLCPPHGFEHTRGWHERIRRELEATQPDIVYVGLGFPKQERLIGELRPSFPAAWFLGVGVSISFVAGDVSRAPRWMQRLGLEWLHRLAQEPGRLARRYLVDGLPFALRLLAGSALRGILAERTAVAPPARGRGRFAHEGEPAFNAGDLLYDRSADGPEGVETPA